MAKHKAIITIEAQIHEVDKNNECSSDYVTKINRFSVGIEGPDRSITERKLNEALAELIEKCQQ